VAQGLRDVKRRIKSVQSTKKITRAMELIAASRFMKAQQRMQGARPYAEAITAALRELSSAVGRSSSLAAYLRPDGEVRKAAVIVVTSDRGLAGPYSSGVLRQAEELYAKLRNDGVEPQVYVTGRKGAAYYRFRSRPLAGSWTTFSEQPTYDDAKAVSEAAFAAFQAGEVQEIYVVYTHFISSLSQQAAVRRLLPLEVVDVERTSNEPRAEYEYEPDAEAVLGQLMPRYIAVRVFNAFLEAAASEQAARRRAMSTATDNASNLIDEYTRQYNQARQASITQELMEVVGAAEAFNGSK